MFYGTPRPQYTYTQICAGLYRGISQYNNNPAATKRSIECFNLFTLSHYALIKYMAEAQTTMHRFSLIFGIVFCESLKDVCRKIVVVYRDFLL
jgi:hypothetical protein